MKKWIRFVTTWRHWEFGAGLSIPSNKTRHFFGRKIYCSCGPTLYLMAGPLTLEIGRGDNMQMEQVDYAMMWSDPSAN